MSPSGSLILYHIIFGWGSTTVCLVLSECVCLCLNVPRIVWVRLVCLDLPECVWLCLSMSGLFWMCLMLSECVWFYLSVSWLAWMCPALSEYVWFCLNVSGFVEKCIWLRNIGLCIFPECLLISTAGHKWPCMFPGPFLDVLWVDSFDKMSL